VRKLRGLCSVSLQGVGSAILVPVLLLLLFCFGCQPAATQRTASPSPSPSVIASPVEHSPSPTPEEPQVQLSDIQIKLLKGARATLGDVYDDDYYGGGPPPDGRGACTDVVYSAYLAAGTNLQDAIESDISVRPGGYPNLGDRNINYRRTPNLIVWFKRHTESLALDSDFQPGDVVFWSLLDDGVADHVGLVSDKPGHIIHNIGPRCREDESLRAWTILGHFRSRRP
jgi:uncharacterized protein YijF (DUF1287 family)